MSNKTNNSNGNINNSNDNINNSNDNINDSNDNINNSNEANIESKVKINQNIYNAPPLKLPYSMLIHTWLFKHSLGSIQPCCHCSFT